MLSLPLESDLPETPSGSPQSPGECFAILYDGSQMQYLPQLLMFHDDLKVLKETVLAAGVPEKNIFLCSGKETGTRKGFGNTILAVLEKAKRNDFVLITMQGYATHLDGVDYILPYDTNPKDISDSVRAPQELVENYRKNFIPVQAVLKLLSQEEKTNDLDKCRKMLVLINPYSVAPADVAKLTIQETFPIIPFGHQNWVLPMGTVVVTSRALRLMPERHALLDASSGGQPKTTIFMRIVLEGLSGLARQRDSDSKDPINTGEFLTFMEHRSEIQDYMKPVTRFHTDFQFRMLPYFEVPPMVQQTRNDVVAQIQVNHYRTGLFLLFNQQDPQSSCIAFANCEGMGDDAVLTRLARLMRFCSYLAYGDIPRLLDENADKQAFPAYIVSQTSVFDAPDGQPITFTAPAPPPPAQTANSSRYRTAPQPAPKPAPPKKLELMPGDRIEIIEVVRTKVDDDPETDVVVENETVDENHIFDSKEWELHHRTENAWVHIRKVERHKMKTYANFDENGRQTGVADGIFEEVTSGQESIQGWVPAEAFNLAVFKYRQDKTLADSLEKIRVELEKQGINRTRTASSANSTAQTTPQQPRTSQSVPQQQTPRR